MRCADSGRAHQAGGVARVGGPLVRPRSSCRYGLRGRRRGRGMAISTETREMLACPVRGSVPVTRRVGEQGVQGRQRGQRRDRLPRRPHRAARDGVEHPDRDLLEARDGRVHEAAARRRAGRALDHLVEANRAPGPGMPSVENGDLVARAGTMGLVVRSCTTPADRIRALTGGRRIKPTSLGCRRSRRPEPGRHSTYQAGKPVQTNRASGSSLGRAAAAGAGKEVPGGGQLPTRADHLPARLRRSCHVHPGVPAMDRHDTDEVARGPAPDTACLVRAGVEPLVAEPGVRIASASWRAVGSRAGPNRRSSPAKA